jgi:CheY-like chemotaxis protein/anti-sigma regulatory factor (Ser/Thr protein kinase)
MNRILVVEDDPHNRAVIRELLEGSGFAITTASDGMEALERLRQEQFDLILVDVWMPRLSGIELLRSLRVEAKTPPRVVVMTADDTTKTVLDALREQAYQYIAKPFNPGVLLDLVKNALAAPAEALPIEVLSARPDWVELLVPCAIGTADRIQGFLAQLRADLPEEVRQGVGWAFRELLLNAIEWGGQLDPNRRVRIAYLRAKRMLLYRIADPGPGFRTEGLTHAAVNNPPDHPCDHMRARQEKDLRPGGFGILMVRAMVDELLYNEAQNEVVLIKYLD